MKRGRTSRLGTLVFLLISSAVRFVAAAPQEQSIRTVDYVSPSLLASDAKPQLLPSAESSLWNPHYREVVATPAKTSTDGDHWEAFESEYGIRHKNPSWFLSVLQSAKYGLDKLSFGAKETAKRLEFTYDFGSPSGPSGVSSKAQYSVPLFGGFGHPQLKSVLTEHDPQTGTPFAGLKLSIPFGEE